MARHMLDMMCEHKLATLLQTGIGWLRTLGNRQRWLAVKGTDLELTSLKEGGSRYNSKTSRINGETQGVRVKIKLRFEKCLSLK